MCVFEEAKNSPNIKKNKVSRTLRSKSISQQARHLSYWRKLLQARLRLQEPKNPWWKQLLKRFFFKSARINKRKVEIP